jgi:hypothetical protein
MKTAERERKQAELAELRARVADLERELEAPEGDFAPKDFYLTYYATAGFFLGMIAAVASLLFNVVGSMIAGLHPLRLIQIYLTFPLGQKALDESLAGGLTLTLGCCLYIGTGMVLGTLFHVLLVLMTDKGTLVHRLSVAACLALGMWFVHFYLILNFLQPFWFGGNWIVDNIPWWVGAATHLVYGLTMVAVYPWGLYVPYRRPTGAPG